jgi:pantetheine-phosphate adenylyltransferase
MAQNNVAIYPGSFDPITNGHVDLVKRTLRVFERVIIAIASNPGKDSSLFSLEERLQMVREVFRGFKRRVQADSFEGLLVDYAERKQARVIIRGLRESEFYISSRLVKEVVSLGGDVSGLVPGNVLTKLVKKFKQ